MSARIQKAVEAALRAPTLIAYLSEGSSEDELLNALGNLQQSAADLSSLRSIYTCGGRVLSQLEDMSRLDAYRLFSALPIPLFYPDAVGLAPRHIKDDEVLGVHLVYGLTAAYLFSWELDILIKDFDHELLEPAHDKAVVCERRFQMIRRMCELGLMPGENPALHWVLAESSECLLALGAGTGEGAITSSRQRYESKQGYLKFMKEKVSEEKRLPPETFEEELPHYGRWIDAVARQFATEESKAGRKFKSQYYKPYCAALTVSNSNQWNKYGARLKSVGVKPKKAGPKIGKKYHQD